MADSLNSIGSISQFLFDSFPGLPSATSGLILLQIADMARQHVENYTGVTIGSNSIADRFQSAILDFAKSDVILFINAQPGGEEIKLADLSISEIGEALSAEQYRMLAESKLKMLGRNIQFRQSLS